MQDSQIDNNANSKRWNSTEPSSSQLDANVSDKKYHSTEPVFRLKPIYRTNTCEVKLVGYMDDNHKLDDELLEFETSKEVQAAFGKNVDLVSKVKNYNITTNIFKNNILGNYLVKNDFLPIFSISFMYEKTLVTGFLFDIFIGFQLDEESKNILKDYSKCVNARLNGKFVLKLYCDEEVIDNYDLILSTIDDTVIQKPEILQKMNDMSEEDFMIYLDGEITQRKTYLTNLKNGIELPELRNMTKTIDMLRNVYKNNDLNNVIQYALEVREDERRKKYNAASEYKIPEKVLNIKDIEKDSEYLSKYLGL
jgi:hypothetical protein